MTLWQPDVSRYRGPRYLAIVAALSEDIEQGRLPSGTRLPTHRALADALGVTVGTVTRAYAEAARRNLVSGEVGRGTFVRAEPQRETFNLYVPPHADEGALDLTIISPCHLLEPEVLQEGLARVAQHPEVHRLLAYQPDGGLPEHRAAAAHWTAQDGVEASAERMVITMGAQHALLAVLASLCRPGETLLTEALTYAGMKGVAKLLHLNVRGVALDAEGLDPERLEHACATTGARVLYTMPTLQNPTTGVQSRARRQGVAEIARRYDLTVIEDNVYGFLPAEAPPPLTTLIPERSYYVNGASKNLAPGVRIGFVLAPEGRAERVASAVRASCWMASPLLAELTAQWINDGTAERITAQQRSEAAARQQLAAALLGPHGLVAPPVGYHAWLPLPEPWLAEDFVAQARERGVLVTPGSVFAAERTAAPHAVRIGLGGVLPRERLREGLSTLAGILQAPPGAGLSDARTP